MIRFWQYTEELFSQPFMDENVLSILYFLKSHNHTSVRKGPKGEFKIYVHVLNTMQKHAIYQSILSFAERQYSKKRGLSVCYWVLALLQ